MSTESNQIGLEDAEKMFAEAFKEARGQQAPAAPAVAEPVITPEVVPAAAEKVEETPKPADVKVDTTPAVKVDVTNATPVTQPANTGVVPDWASKLDTDTQHKILEVLHAQKVAEHKYRSDLGRQSALQRQILERDKRIADLSSQRQKPSDDNQTAAGKQDQAKTLEAWKQLNEAEPAIASGVDSRIKALEDQLNQKLTAVTEAAKAQTDPLYQQQERAHVEEQRRLLTDAVPNYVEVVNHPVYKYWYDTYAGNGLRQLASSSTDYQDALNILNIYGQWASRPESQSEMIARGLIKATEVTNEPVQTVQNPGTDTALADRVAKSRENKVATAPVIQNNSLPINPVAVSPMQNSKPGEYIDIDSEAAQNYFAEAFKKNKR